MSALLSYHRTSAERSCRTKDAKFETKIPKYSPKFAPTFPMLCLLGRNVWRRGHRKRDICTKLSEINFQICDNFAHLSSDVRNEVPAILRKFGAQFAQRPPRERPLLGISD